MNTIGTLPIGATGTVVGGKFDGRTFTVRSKGTQGVVVTVDWTEQGTTGSVRSTTTVTVQS